MKICALIAEYNPFHLGHLKHLDYIKNTLGAEKIIVVMSGNFTQRGEPAILDKYTRAKHAIIAGADLVIELPTVFATGNAEVFAKGAINVINSLGVVDGLCFGVESGDKQSYQSLADLLNEEPKEYKRLLKSQLDMGVSLAKAKHQAVKDLGESFDSQLMNSPNNILGLEYTKALKKIASDINVFPMIREGDHNDKTLKKGITSATSIRECVKTGKLKKVKGNLPPFVFSELDKVADFDKIIMSSLLTASLSDMQEIMDCTEGIENRIKALSKDNLTLESLIEKVCTKRYTKSRIRRILIANLLKINKRLVENCLDSKLYAKVLAVAKNSKDLISMISAKSQVPLLTRKSDTVNLKKIAKECYEKDVLANDLYNLATQKVINENYMLII